MPIKKKKTIPQSLRQQVWNTYISEKDGTGQCWCCKTKQITPFDFHCGHVESESEGGKTELDNLRPICATCNLSMGTKNMHEFIKECNFDKPIVKFQPNIISTYNLGNDFNDLRQQALYSESNKNIFNKIVELKRSKFPYKTDINGNYIWDSNSMNIIDYEKLHKQRWLIGLTNDLEMSMINHIHDGYKNEMYVLFYSQLHDEITNFYNHIMQRPSIMNSFNVSIDQFQNDKPYYLYIVYADN